MMGRIHSFESCGTVDGPGIRYVIFMQGCPLKCVYCHNRDTWDKNAGRGDFSVEDIMERVRRYKTYMLSSNGGVTISGGEPLLQTSFVLSLVKQLKEEGFHVTIDTSGAIFNEDVKEVLKYVDLVLLDIKSIDSEKFKFITGLTIDNTLKFATYLSEIGKPMWIRQVIVPGLTDVQDDIIGLKKFLSNLTNVSKVEFLPYHSMGKYKWEELLCTYPLEGTRDANSDDIREMNRIYNEA